MDIQDLRVTAIQTYLHWEEPAANLDMFDRLLEGLEGKTDLVVLPEMFSTGFSMRPELLAEEMDGLSVEWLKKKAHGLQSVITGSLIISDKGEYFNRLIWMQPDGNFQVYDKRHLFTLAREQDHYSPGHQRLIAKWKGWKVCPLTCYDLRFPVWSRNTEAYDLLLYVANWPERRSIAWKSLLQARAIENQAYTIGVNRVGADGNKVEHSGDSTIIDYSGAILYQLSRQKGFFTSTLSYSNQQKFRQKFQFLQDQDEFTFE